CLWVEGPASSDHEVWQQIWKLFSNVDYSTGDYRISRSYDLDVRIEAIINEAQNELYSVIDEIQSLIV
ncbi:hypothetical protein Q604_UNBc4C00150G0001, partial [human gut metagenome]